MILTQQLSELVKDVYGDMTNGKSGTGTALFVKTQTGLIAGVAATDVALTNKSFTSSSIVALHFLDTSTGNGSILTEHEVNNGVISYNRSVKAGLLKASTNEFNVIHTFDFEIVP